MPMLSNVKLHMELIADLKKRGATHIEIGKDMEMKAQAMLAYAQCHCEHEFIKPIAAYAHEGGNCKHCGVNEQYAPTARRTWLAMEDAGTAPWGPRGNKSSTAAKSMPAGLRNDALGFKGTAK